MIRNQGDCRFLEAAVLATVLLAFASPAQQHTWSSSSGVTVEVIVKGGDPGPITIDIDPSDVRKVLAVVAGPYSGINSATITAYNTYSSQSFNPGWTKCDASFVSGGFFNCEFPGAHDRVTATGDNVNMQVMMLFVFRDIGTDESNHGVVLPVNGWFFNADEYNTANQTTVWDNRAGHGSQYFCDYVEPPVSTTISIPSRGEKDVEVIFVITDYSYHAPNPDRQIKLRATAGSQSTEQVHKATAAHTAKHLVDTLFLSGVPDGQGDVVATVDEVFPSGGSNPYEMESAYLGAVNVKVLPVAPQVQRELR